MIELPEEYMFMDKQMNKPPRTSKRFDITGGPVLHTERRAQLKMKNFYESERSPKILQTQGIIAEYDSSPQFKSEETDYYDEQQVDQLLDQYLEGDDIVKKTPQMTNKSKNYSSAKSPKVFYTAKTQEKHKKRTSFSGTKFTKKKMNEIEEKYNMHTQKLQTSSRPQTASFKRPMKNWQQQQEQENNARQNLALHYQKMATEQDIENVKKISVQQQQDENKYTINNIQKSMSSTTTSPKTSKQLQRGDSTNALKGEVEMLVEKIQNRRVLNQSNKQQYDTFTNINTSHQNKYNPQQFNQKKNVSTLQKRPQTAIKRHTIQNISSKGSNNNRFYKNVEQFSDKNPLQQSNKSNLEKLVDDMLIKATNPKRYKELLETEENNNDNKIEDFDNLENQENQENREEHENYNKVRPTSQDTKVRLHSNFTQNTRNVVNPYQKSSGNSRATSAVKKFYDTAGGFNRQATVKANNFVFMEKDHTNNIHSNNNLRTVKMRKPPVPRFSHPNKDENNENNKYDKANKMLVMAKTNSEKQLGKYQLNQRPTTAGPKRFSDGVSKKYGFVDSVLQETFYKNNLVSTGQTDRYKFGNAIGKGSYAIVRQGTDTHTNRSVAIKTYDKFKLLDNQKRTNLRREIQILKVIEHNNIIKLYNTIDTRTTVSLVMEFIGTLTLRQFIKEQTEKRIKESEAQIIFSQVVSAVSYLHSNNIIHRDIKLENIMINPSGLDIRLIDFGFAIRSDRKLGVFCGTPSYMAPEIVKKQEYYGKPADVWALGILLFAMLYGKFPFKGKDDYDLYRKIQKCDIQLPAGVSPRARNLLEQIFKKNPNERITCREILKDSWFQA